MTDPWAPPPVPDRQCSAPAVFPGAPPGPGGDVPGAWDPFTGAPVARRPKRRRRTRWIVAPAVVGAVAFAAIGAVLVFRESPPPEESVVVAEPVRVADIPAEPTVAWTVDLTVGVELEYLADATVVAVGEGKAVVIPEYDDKGRGGYPSSQWNPAQLWYEGYEEDYEAGYAAGLVYAEQLEQYEFGEGTSFPDADDFWPFEGSIYDKPSVRSGFVDGFRDAETEAAKGANALRVPADTEYVPTAMLVDLETGTIDWQTNLSAHLADYEREVYFEVFDVVEADYIVVNAVVTDSDRNVVITLDKATGSVIDSREYDAYTWAFVEVDETAYYVLEHDWASGSAVLKRYDNPEVSSQASWWTRCEGDGLVLDQGMVFVYGGKPAAIDADKGVPTKLSTTFGSEHFFFSVGEHLIRARMADSGRLRLTEVDEEGIRSWRSDVETTYFVVADGMLFVGDLMEDDVDYDTVSNLMRIDPSSGREMWEEAFAEEIVLRGDYIDGGLGAVGGFLAVSEPDGTRSWAIDVATGEVSRAEGTGYTVAFGESQYFTVSHGTLAAYTPSASSAVWTYALEDDEYPAAIGTHLLVFDAGDGELSGLN